MTKTLVLDASAWVDILLNTPLGERVTLRITDAAVHAPAHIDLEMLSAFGRIERSGALPAADIDTRIMTGQLMLVTRHPLPDLVDGAWSRRGSLRISDAYYVELAARLDTTVVTTDQRLARATPLAELVEDSQDD